METFAPPERRECTKTSAARGVGSQKYKKQKGGSPCCPGSTKLIPYKSLNRCLSSQKLRRSYDEVGLQCATNSRFVTD